MNRKELKCRFGGYFLHSPSITLLGCFLMWNWRNHQLMSSMSGWVEQELNVEKISQKWNNLRRKVKELKKQNLLDHAEKLEKNGDEVNSSWLGTTSRQSYHKLCWCYFRWFKPHDFENSYKTEKIRNNKKTIPVNFNENSTMETKSFWRKWNTFLINSTNRGF